ncbi:hypothetical protein, partial [Rufibacter sediminis]|uniref:hypothetical protein n=1 Tax=Rufibacter sediminis TaxID=2762756 RepID=UPI0019D5C610
MTAEIPSFLPLLVFSPTTSTAFQVSYPLLLLTSFLPSLKAGVAVCPRLSLFSWMRKVTKRIMKKRNSL